MRHYRIITLIIILIIATNPLYSQSESEVIKALNNDQCVNCHYEMDMMPADFSELDIHLQKGLSCAGCHGGDPTKMDPMESMSEENGFIGVPARDEIPEFCGKCHSSIEFMRKYQPSFETDQVSQYYTSLHGRQLKKGDKNVAECASCHTAHSILPADDPRASIHPLNIPSTCNKCHGDKELMNQYNLRTDQFEEYSNSIHGRMLLKEQDIGAPACNDCHGNHGAKPPGVKSIANVCGTCHVNNMKYFKQTRMAEVFKTMDVHACEQCHGHHDVSKTSDKMIGTGENSVCITCHSEGDKGYQTAEVMGSQLNKLSSLYDSAQVRSNEVQVKGMNNTDINYLIQQVNQKLIKSRTLVHTFDSEKVKERTNEGIKKANKALTLAGQEVEEYYIRRIGFGGASLFLLLLIVGLYFKLKQVGKKNE